MPAKLICPDTDSLQRLAQGRLHSSKVEPLASHLESCEQCVVTLEGLHVDDTLVEAVRAGAASVRDTSAPAVAELIERLRTLPAASSQSVEATADGSGSAVQTPSEAATGSAHSVAPAPDVTQELLEFLAPAQAADELGRLGPYRVLKPLGSGGMGVVYLAEDTQLKRLVALKVMRPTLAAIESARRRFTIEAQATAAIEHDHIVGIYQVGEDRGVPFIAMQFLRGESLDDRLKREPKLPLAESLRIAREIADGLAAAHECGLIHRDIKPANVWLEEKGLGVRGSGLGTIPFN